MDPSDWNGVSRTGQAPPPAKQPSFPGLGPLAAGLQQPAAASPASGWVSFDDDGGGGAFGGSAAAPPVAAAAAVPLFPPTAPFAPQPAVTAAPAAPVPSSSLARPPSHASHAAPTVNPFANAPPSAPAPGPAQSRSFSPLSSAAARSAFPTFAALHATQGEGAAPAPAAAASPPTSSGPPPPRPADAVQRLPRPPSSAVRPAGASVAAAPAAAAAGGLGGGAPAAPAPASNPFASAARPPGVAAASSFGRDPFADLSIRPPPPRPPPMAAKKEPPAPPAPAAEAPAPAAPPPPPAFPTFAALHGAEPTPPPTSGAARPPPPPEELPSPHTTPHTASMFPSFPGLSALPSFPTFGTAHADAAEARAHLAAPASVTQPHAPAAAQTGSRDTGGGHAVQFPSFAALRGTFAAQPVASPHLQRTHRMGSTGDAASLAPGSGLHGWHGDERPRRTSATNVAPWPDDDAPPAYEQAVEHAPAQPPPPPSYVDAVGMHAAAPPPPPPPPPYTEAVGMPEASMASAALPPPPSYDDALAAPPAAGAASREPEWAMFDVTLDGAAAGGSPAAAGAAVSPSAPSTTAGPAAQQLPGQICVEVRLPPLRPKDAAWPTRLVAGLGHVIVAPGGDEKTCMALQYCLRPGAKPGAPAGPRFEVAANADTQQPAEDWDSAPCSVVPRPPVMSESPVTTMLVDETSGSLFTGHKDGRVVRWSLAVGRAVFYAHHWKAHAVGKVVALALTPWGELWTASTSGSVRVWGYLGGTPAGRPPFRLFECRRARLALGPMVRASSQRAHSKSRVIAVGPSGRVVWTAGRSGLALWGAYDGEFLGSLIPGGGGGAVVASEGQPYAGDTGMGQQQQQRGQEAYEINPKTGLEPDIITRLFAPRAPPETLDEADNLDGDLSLQVRKGFAGAVKMAAKLGKKIRANFAADGGGSGTADGVAPPEGAALSTAATLSRGKVVGLVPGLDASMYVVYKHGTVEKYTEWGRLLWGRDLGIEAHLHCAALVGPLLWLGCDDGTIRTVGAGLGEPARRWVAHDFPVVALAADGGPAAVNGLVYSLGEQGGVRAWAASLPTEAQLVAWRDGLLPCLRRHALTVLAGTWNVNETRPSPESLRAWLARAAVAEVVSVALQEVEMGTSSVAMDAAIQFLSKATLEKGNQNAQWWATELSAALASTNQSWVRVALRQMSGLVVVVFVRADLSQHVGEVATAHVPCGVMGVGGNKGAVAVSLTIFRRRIMFVGSHFAAHQERVEDRNENYAKIVRLLHFHNTSKAAQQQKQAAAGAAGASAAADAAGDLDLDGGMGLAESTSDLHGPGMADAAMLVWGGDFNYRINGSYEDVCARVNAGMLAELFKHDQCKAEMERGNVFRGMREGLPLGHPLFVPTYKFDKGDPVYQALPPAALELSNRGRAQLKLRYDSSEKQRVPAWTDRIFFRGSRPGSHDVAEEEVVVSVTAAEDYNCVLDVVDSDHKPVYAVLQVQLPAYKQEEKRRHSLACAAAVHAAAVNSAGPVPPPAPQSPSVITCSAAHVSVQPNGPTATLTLHNHSAAYFIVNVFAARPQPSGGAHQPIPGPLPTWLEVSPMRFVLRPHQGAQGGAAVVRIRALGGDGIKPPDPARLLFNVRPMCGLPTLAGVPGPTTEVTLTQ